MGTAGTTPISSLKFLVLPDYPDSHFLEVALDSGVLLGSSSADPSSVLSIIRANELAQASLAKACILATPSPLTDAIVNVVPPSPSSIPVPKVGVALGSSTSLDDCDHPIATGKTRRKKNGSLLAPPRSSLRIKILSFK